LTALTLFPYVSAFILGTLLGSFTNVVIYRLPRHESLILPRSRCPHCGSLIHSWDNIPILSFLFLRGRCRSCRRQISWRYPLVELLAGIIVLLIWIHVSSTSGASEDGPRVVVEFLGDVVFGLMMLAIFFIDLEHRIIPNAITYPGLVVGLLLAIPQDQLLEAAASAIGAGGAFLLIAVLSRGGMGGGDVKLAAVMGAFLGWPTIAVALMLAFLLGAAGGLLLLVLRRGTRKTAIPFGPALAVGAVIALLAGTTLLQWYQSLGR
jgi:leader peptidase (prepilin peptidase)/N-methyltransferase